MQDESVREIQLNGKQLVFLFMTATAAAVVIFLCGVMVGRGIGAPPELSAIPTTPLDPTSVVLYGEQGAPPDDASASPAARLARFEEPPIETDVAAPEPEPERSETAAPVVFEPVPDAPVPQPSDSSPEPAGADSARPAVPPVDAVSPERAVSPGDYVVQVHAVRARSQADSIAADLTSKGFPAFVSAPGAGAAFFRVRVGPYHDSGEARRVAARLEAEEQLTPWITH